MKRLLLGLAASAVLISGSSKAAAGTVYNLADDWSDSSNPNSPWSYRSSPTTILTHHLGNWDPFPMAPAWADIILPNVGHIPVFLKAIGADGNPNDDFPLGHIYMHGNDNTNSPAGFGDQPAGIFWTAPAAGLIQITGDMWEVTRNLGRSEDWALVMNGQTVTSGTLTPTNATSAAPLDLATGTGGNAALSLAINAGDVIALEFMRHPGTLWGTLTGVDLQFDLGPPIVPDASAPEPQAAVIWSLAAALFGAGGLRRRFSFLPQAGY